MKRSLKNLILWSHGRETTVYVLFCLLIVAFIFLTPPSWFNSREKLATQTSRVIVQAKDFSPDSVVLSKRVKELSGNPEAEIVGVNEKKNAAGETIYEVDIR